jgi:hypothetical protein
LIAFINLLLKIHPMESHKKILGILFVVFGSFQLLLMVFLGLFFTTIFTFAISQAEPDQVKVLEMILSIIRYVPIVIIVFISFPSLAAGIGLLAKQKWAMILALIMGCFNLLSFPFGTALGIYTIWVYAEDNRMSKLSHA